MQGLVHRALTAEAAELSNETNKLLYERFGTLHDSMWALIGMISGGVDWLTIAAPVRDLGWAYSVAFMGYICFVFFGLMNLLTGIFVNAATQSSVLNREIA